MREFFQGWRRKAGLVTLAMALLALMLWFRSHVITDTISEAWPGDDCWVKTSGGQIVWSRSITSYSGDTGPPPSGGSGLSWRTSRAADLQLPADYQYSWRRSFPGSEFAVASQESRIGHNVIIATIVSRWDLSLLWFVLPLTLISAWLLLIKPRGVKSIKEPNVA
jgi:hypothetical protein